MGPGAPVSVMAADFFIARHFSTAVTLYVPPRRDLHGLNMQHLCVMRNYAAGAARRGVYVEGGLAMLL